MNEPDFHLRISSKKTYFIFDVKRDNIDHGYTPCNMIVFIQSLFVCYRKKPYFLRWPFSLNMSNDIISAVFSSFRKIERHMHDTFKHR